MVGRFVWLRRFAVSGCCITHTIKIFESPHYWRKSSFACQYNATANFSRYITLSMGVQAIHCSLLYIEMVEISQSNADSRI